MLRVYDMYSCMHNYTIYRSSVRLGRLINLKCKCVPSMFNQLTVKITFVVNVMFSLPIPPSSSLLCTDLKALHCMYIPGRFAKLFLVEKVKWKPMDRGIVGRED